MPWHARLDIDYLAQHAADANTAPHTTTRTVAHFVHDGPLRVLQTLYPEGPSPCHNVLVHPPGGLVGGDRLDIGVTVQAGAHGLVSTPGATRFYRSEAGRAEQQVRLRLAPGARLEWLPLETLAYRGCDAVNALHMALAPGSELIAWDVCALGLPESDQPFSHGRIEQRMSLAADDSAQPRWLERGVIDAADHRLLQSPLGLDGQRCTATLVWACGSPIERTRRDTVLELLRQAIDQQVDQHGLQHGDPRVRAGATSPHSQVVVVRALGPLVEPVMALCKHLWGVLRPAVWQLPATRPRIWSV